MTQKHSRSMQAHLIATALGLLLIAACSPPFSPTSNAQGTLTVFAASSLTDAFNEMNSSFVNAHPSTRVAFNFAGSQDLRTQIEQGASADVFASADTRNMDPLKAAGLVEVDPMIMARNRLVVIVPSANPAQVQSLRDLSKPGLKLVVADPGVPVGNYAVQMLQKLSSDPAYGSNFAGIVLSRVVSRENNVKQVVSKVVLGEADAGIVYSTDAQAAGQKVKVLDIPDPFNVTAIYPIAVLKASKQTAVARQFVDWVVSQQGQAILKKYGFR